jgi:2-dehydro-3-deoxygluconokinase
MGYDLVTFGEAMVRLTSPGHMRLEQSSALEVSVGGAEWNVVVNVSKLGKKTAWVSRLVDNWTGQLILNHTCTHGVGTGYIQWSKFDGVGRERNGFYHLENGIGPRASKVTYDRAYSAMSNMKPGDVDWKNVLSDAEWFHVTGITPALSPSLAEVTKEALQAARKKGIETSYDLNYRSKLWDRKIAQKVTKEIIPYVTVLIGNEEDFEAALSIKAMGTDENYSRLDLESYKDVAKEVVRVYPNLKLVGTTLRNAKTGLLNDWQALLFDREKFYISKMYENLEIEDRVGGGDSFGSGLIYSLLEKKGLQEAVEFAAAYSALAHTFPGDVNWATREEVEKLMLGKGARISR